MPKFRVFLRFLQSRFRAKMLGYESPEPSDVIKAFFLTDTDIKINYVTDSTTLGKFVTDHR